MIKKRNSNCKVVVPVIPYKLKLPKQSILFLKQWEIYWKSTKYLNFFSLESRGIYLKFFKYKGS